MASQGRSIEAVVTLDLKPFRSKISEVKTLLNELSNGINIDFGGSKLARQMDDLKRILRGVSEEAEKITTAFNKIEGMSRLLESLGQVKSKLEYIQNDIDKINQSILKESQEVKKVASVEEKVVSVEQKRATALGQVGRELIRQGNEIKKNLTYEEEMIATENLFKNGLAEEMSLYAEKVQLQEQIRAINESDMAIRNGIATNVKDILAMTDEELALLREELMLEEQILGVEKQQTSEQKRQNSTRTQGNQLDSMSYLPRRIGSMALTMWGFNEIMDVYDKTMSHINAESQKDYFAKRMGMDKKATDEFTQSLERMQNGWTDATGNFHKGYKKLDMTVVGANALETATKYKVQEESLGDLTEVMAIYGSEFVKQGRSQEDSILAINDALDGELRRLKEVGIGAEELEATGLWSGDETDKEGMLKALLQIAQERGYDKTAKDITNLSDAITTLEVKLSIDLARAFGVIEPLLTDVLGNFVTILEALESAISYVTPKITEFAKSLGLIDKDGNATQFGNFLEDWASWLITFGIVAFGVYKIAKPLLGMFGKLKDVGGSLGKETGDIGKTMNTGGFKENFSSEWGKLGKNLGKMARVFVEVAVAMAMAFALIEEGILLISAVGYTYESLKPQFNQGIEFIKEFGLWFALLGGAMLGLSYALDKIPQGTEKAITKGATRLAYGLAIAMGLIAEAIVLLIAPMTAIALLGGTASFLGTNLDKGLEVISWIGNALHQIDLPVALFIGGFLAISLLLGLVQPLTIGLAVGIASALLLVTEAIVMLIPPLTAIALLGGTASMLGEDKIQQGAETIKMMGKVLQVLAEAIPYLLIVDIGVFAVQLVDWGNRLLSGGKDGLTTLVENILPTLVDFVKKLNGIEVGEPVDQAKVQAIEQMAIDIPPLFRAIQKVNNAMGTGDAVGNIFGALGGGISGAIGMGLSAKLDQLYNDIRDVMNFANKLGGLSTGGGANANAITQTANAIAQLKVKLNLFITTISSASSRVQSASQKLGSALTTGFKTGSASFNSTVVSVLSQGINEVQSRYATWQSGGKASAQKLVDGFKTIGGKLKSSVREEMGYALSELDNYKDDFYNKGAMLGQSLVDGFKSKKGFDQNSPAKITKSIREELGYSMEALNTGKQMMYQGGVALGQALTNGYNSYGNLRTDVGVLASKGVNSEQLQANAKNIQLNGNQKGKTPQLTQTNINIDMSNSTVIGVQDLDNKIRQAVEKAIVSINSPNGAIGY